MKTCPICYEGILDSAVKCRYCHSSFKPRTNEGQFWGTGLMVGGILISLYCYIGFLSQMAAYYISLMKVGVILAFVGFLVFGFGTFQSWFFTRNKAEKCDDDRDKVPEGQKKCFFCCELIDARAIKCHYCNSFLRQEKGKVLSTFIVVSGILVLNTAYVFFLAQSYQAELYMNIGSWIIIFGVLMFITVAIRDRYAKKY